MTPSERTIPVGESLATDLTGSRIWWTCRGLARPKPADHAATTGLAEKVIDPTPDATVPMALNKAGSVGPVRIEGPARAV